MNGSYSQGSGLHLIVDGIVYGLQKHGGINTYFNENLSRLARRKDLALTLLVPYRCQGRRPRMTAQLFREPLPASTGWSWKLDEVARPLLRRTNELVTQRRVKQARSRTNWPCVFQSTYFTLTEDALPQVAVAYDMNHEIFPDKYQDDWGSWLRRQYRDYLQRATRVMAISHKTKEDIRRFYGLPAERIDVVYPAVNRDIFRPERSEKILGNLRAHLGVCQPYVLYVGARGGYKNFAGLLEGFAQSAVKSQLHLVVAGKSWRESEQEHVRRLGLAARIHLVGSPSDGLLRALYSCAAAFIYPSLHEGFGIPLLEAMACGTLVLASDIAIFREVAVDAAVYFNPADPSDLARVLEIPFRDPMRQEYIARGLEQVARYSWDTCAEQTYHVYQKALASQHG